MEFDKNFQPVERLRAPEFTRDWGLPIITEQQLNKLPSLSLESKMTRSNDWTESFFKLELQR